MNNQTFSKVGILIILIILIGGGILVWSYLKNLKQAETSKEQAPEVIIKDETADWKTYRSEEYGFEMMYPKEWEFLVNDPHGKKYPSFRDKKYSGSFEWPGLNIEWPPFYGLEIPEKESRIFKLEDEKNGLIIISFTKGAKRIIAICKLYLDPDVIKICNQMLSTFRFIN